jgi:hypothetical protein
MVGLAQHGAVMAAADTSLAQALEGDAVLGVDYTPAGDRISQLYRMSTSAHWRVDDLDWSADVDVAALGETWLGSSVWARSSGVFTGWPRRRQREYHEEWTRFLLSQILHGEQLALLASSRLTVSLPTVDAKLFAATQSADEARHVEFFSRYLNGKLGGIHDAGTSVWSMLRVTATDPCWDVLFLGSNVMLEGLALAIFALLRRTVQEPLLLAGLQRVNADEARHVAFGHLSLRSVYAEMSALEIRERQELAAELARDLIARFEPRPIWEQYDFTDEQIASYRECHSKPAATILFSKVVPACARLGLLDAGDGWLRRRFGELGIGFFADWSDGS